MCVPAQCATRRRSLSSFAASSWVPEDGARDVLAEELGRVAEVSMGVGEVLHDSSLLFC
jgi:hypothetical protein